MGLLCVCQFTPVWTCLLCAHQIIPVLRCLLWLCQFTPVQFSVRADDVLEHQHLPRVGCEDGDVLRGVSLLQQVAAQSDTQLRLMLVRLAACLVV